MEEPKDVFKGKNVDINILKLVDIVLIVSVYVCICLLFVVYVFIYVDITRLTMFGSLSLIGRFTKALKILKMSLQ